ncbi:hypothetical protein Tco_1511299, partial [Tanacetum coccineum]
YVSKKIDEGPLGVLPCQLPPKELSPGSFTLPLTIGSLNVYAMISYGNSKISDTTRARRYNEWFEENNKHQNYRNTTLPYLRDYIIAPGRIINPYNMENPILSIKSYFPNSSQAHHNKPRPRYYSFKEWLKVKVGYTNVNKSMKNVVLNEWILDIFDVESSSLGMSNNPYSRNLEKYKSVFDNEIE